MDTDTLGNPVDRGWSWVILAGICRDKHTEEIKDTYVNLDVTHQEREGCDEASTVISFLHIGSIKAFGLFFVEFLEIFDASVSVTSLISSLQNVFFAVVALPVLSIGINFRSSRCFCLIGGILCTAAYALSAFAMSVEFLIFTLSIVFGAGSGFLFPPTLVILGKYFKKRRGFANGLTMAGACLGGLAYPLFIRLCIDEYGARGALFLVAGVYMHILIAASLLTPPEQYKVKLAGNLPERENLLHSPIVKNTGNLKFIHETNNISTSLPNIRAPQEPVKKRRTVTISDDERISTSKEHKTATFPQYLSNISLMSISSVDLRFQKSTKNVNIKTMKWYDYLKNMDFSVLKQTEFTLFLISFCFSVIPAIFYVFLPAFARERGITDQEILILVCLAGFMDFLGRVSWGFLSDNPRIRTSHIIVLTMLITGTVSQMVRLLETFWSFCVFIIIYGLFAGSPFALFSHMTIKIVGIEKFPTAYAFLILAQTCTFATAIPFAGYLRDVTGSYFAPCHYIGTNALLSALLFLLEPLAQKMDSQIKDKIESKISQKTNDKQTTNGTNNKTFLQKNGRN